MNLRLYDVIYSLQRFFQERLGVRVDWIYDGYKHPDERPYMTIEVITDERTAISKQREAVRIVEHLQLGYHATNIVDRTKKAEEIADLLTFNKIPYFDTEKSHTEPVGDFLCEVVAVTPMPADDISKESERHRVYFDIEIEKIVRGGIK